MEAEVHDTPNCKNCGAPLGGEFCSRCGQRDYDFNRSFGELAAELAESFWNWDTKLIRAVYDLLFRPGFLTTEYLAGRRASQVPPLRFYLFVSILYFLVASFSPTGPLQIQSPGRDGRTEELPLDPQTASAVRQMQDAAAEVRAAGPGSTEKRFNEFFRERMSHIDEIQRAVTENYPKLLFALLPVFALITRLVFRRAKLGYLSHLVLALHLHTFFFLFTVAVKGWTGLIGFGSTAVAGVFDFGTALYVVVYAFMAARRVFGCSRWGTVWRAALTGLLYVISLGVGSAIFVISLFLLA